MAECYICHPCSLVEEETVASNWCVECEFFLCSRCSKLHKAIPSLKTHIILDKTVYLTAKFDFSITKCKTHTDHQLEFLCEDDQQLCCQLCLTSVHSSCKYKSPLGVVSKNVKQSSNFSESLIELDRLSSVFENLFTDRNENKKSIRKQVECIKEKIHESKRIALQKIDDAEKSSLAELSRLEKQLLQKLDSDKEFVKSSNEKRDDLKQQANFISNHGTDKQAFIFLQSLNRDLQELENKTQKEVQKFKTFSFKIGGFETSFMSLSSMLKTVEKPCKISFKPYKIEQAQSISLHRQHTNLKKFDIKKRVKIQFLHTQSSNITSMAYSSCDKLLLADCNSDAGVLLSDSDLRVIKPIETMCKFPWDVSIIPNTTIAVVHFLNTAFCDFGDKETCPRTVLTQYELSGVCATNKLVFCVCFPELKCFDSKGKLLWHVSLKNNKNASFESYIHVHENGFIYISVDKQVICVKMDGTTIFKYSPTNLKSARKITSDDTGVVYVVDQVSNNVHRLTEDGRFIDTIFDGELTKPQAICFSKDFNRCYVSNDSGQSVYIYDCN